MNIPIKNGLMSCVMFSMMLFLSASVFANQECSEVIDGSQGPDALQAAINAAGQGHTICLTGDFDLDDLTAGTFIRGIAIVGKDGLTLTSKDKHNPARIFSTGKVAPFNAYDILPRESNNLTISHLIFEANPSAGSAIAIVSNGFGSGVNNLSINGNYASGYQLFVDNFVVFPGNAGINDVEVSNNTIVSPPGASGAVRFNEASNVVVRNNHLQPGSTSTNGFVTIEPGVHMLNANGNLVIVDNVLDGGLEVSPVKFGIYIDGYTLGKYAERSISSLKVKRNTMLGNWHSGIVIAGRLGPSPLPFPIPLNQDPYVVSNVQILANNIVCAGHGGLNDVFGQLPGAVKLVALDNASINNVDLINNTFDGCDMGLYTAGNVTDVRALGIPETREALGFEFPPTAVPAVVEVGEGEYILAP